MAMGCFSTTILTISFAMMGWRGVTVETMSIGNLCFAAGLGLVISAQWEMTQRNTFSYTVLTAYGMMPLNHPVLGEQSD